MMNNISYKVITFILICTMIFPITVSAETVTYGNVLDDLSAAQKKLNENQASINASENQIVKNNSTVNTLKNEIEEMSKEREELQQEIADANIEIEEKREATKNIIAYYQMSQGENIYLEYVFGSDSITDMVYRLSVVEQITEYNDQMIAELEDLITTNENKKVELANKETEYESKIENLNNEITKLTNSISSLGELSPSLEQEVATKKKLVEYYKSEGCKNRSDVIGVDCAVSTANAIFTRPIKTGYITSFVGYRGGSLHRGLDMGSSTGKNTAIYSIGTGVVKSIWKDSSGALCVNIEYKAINGTYYTAIYGHLSRYGSIYEGMQVNSNTIIGYMGNTGYSFGVHLHLEVWPCRLYADSNCKTWSSYVSFAQSQYSRGFHGAESVISFPSKTYTTWYNK